MPARLLSALVALLAAALVVGLFFDWTETDGGEFDIGARTGLDSSPGFLSLATGIALLLWEVLGALEVRRTGRADSLVAFFLAAGSGLAAIAGVVHLKWSAQGPFTGDLAPAALLVIPLAILLVAGAIAHLGLYVLEQRSRA